MQSTWLHLLKKNEVFIRILDDWGVVAYLLFEEFSDDLDAVQYAFNIIPAEITQRLPSETVTAILETLDELKQSSENK